MAGAGIGKALKDVGNNLSASEIQRIADKLGVSTSRVADKASSMGISMGGATQNVVAASSSGSSASAPSGSPGGGSTSSGGNGGQNTGGAALPKITSVRQGLRVLGSDGISGQELKSIEEATGKSVGQIIKRLDIINEKLSSKDRAGISLNTGAANRAIRKGTKEATKSPFGSVNFGTGAIGLQIAERIGDPGSQGIYKQGQVTGERDAVAPNFLAQGMQIRPAGKEGVRGRGAQYEVPQRFLPAPPPPPEENSDPGSITVGGDGGGPLLPPPEPDESFSSGAGGADLSSWATGFKRAKSARKRAGRMAEGLASMRIAPFAPMFGMFGNR